MDINKSLKEAVLERNMNRVRSIILCQIDSDRNRYEYETIDSCHYAEAELAKNAQLLFDEDNKKTKFLDSTTTWDKNLWQTLRVEFEYNYSKIKFDRIIRVMHHLREQGDPDFVVGVSKARTTTNSGGNQNAKPKQPELNQNPANTYVIPSVTGAVIGGIVGSLAKMAIPGIVVGALIAAAIVFAKKNSKD